MAFFGIKLYSLITDTDDNFSHIYRLFLFPFWSTHIILGEYLGLPSRCPPPATPPSRHTWKPFLLTHTLGRRLMEWQVDPVPSATTVRPRGPLLWMGNIICCPQTAWYPLRLIQLTPKPQSSRLSWIKFYDRMKEQAFGTPSFGTSILYRKGQDVGGGDQLFFFQSKGSEIKL